ncbi:MAG: cobalamin-dependent protein [Synergistaceae bacterium]|nr:cobalamin-dependent protein [Synergistaceae bacterium]
MDEKEVYSLAIEAILEADADKANKALDSAKTAGIPFINVLNNGFSKGMEEFGEMFSSGEVFLPQLIVSAKVMSGAAARIEEDILASGGKIQKKGKAVIATVAGDVHDIGKGIVCTMLRAAGIEVYDLGRDVQVDAIIAKSEEVEADIIGTSTLLTHCMAEQLKLEDELKKRGIRDKYRTVVGGAPVTRKWANKIGADYYGNDGNDGVKVCNEILNKKYG